MIQAASFVNGEFDHVFGAWGQADLSKGHAVSMANNKLNGVTNRVQVHAKTVQNMGSDPFSLTYQPQQEVFGVDRIMLEALRFFLSETQGLPGPVCELIKPAPIVHCWSPSFRYHSAKLLVSFYTQLVQRECAPPVCDTSLAVISASQQAHFAGGRAAQTPRLRYNDRQSPFLYV